jgi:hypothetical protein
MNKSNGIEIMILIVAMMVLIGAPLYFRARAAPFDPRQFQLWYEGLGKRP